MISKIINLSKFLRKKIFNYSNFQKNTVNNYFLNLEQDEIKKIKTIYDIGAHKGQWTKDMKTIFKNSNFYLFEANESNYKQLKHKNKNSFIVLLAEENSHKDFYQRGETGDSYYKQVTGYINVDKKKILCHKLDDYIKRNQLPKPDFIKLDTQGSELDILKGSVQTLQDVRYLLVEMPIIQYNEGCPNIQDYLIFLASKKFYPVELIEKQIHKGKLVQIDILFKNEQQ